MCSHNLTKGILNLTYIATLTKGILDDLDDATLGDCKQHVELVEVPLMFCYQKILLKGDVGSLGKYSPKSWFQIFSKVQGHLGVANADILNTSGRLKVFHAPSSFEADHAESPGLPNWALIH